MEKRYQVFVSSTYEDLKEERSKIITALLDMGHIPCGMEYFPAADEDAWNCIERLIPQCDYYVVLIAGKYGSIAPGGTKSYTHKEYELAVASQIPVLGLLHRSPNDLSKKLCEDDPKTQKKLDQLRTLVQRRLCRFWTTADQIPGELLASLAHQINRIPRVGWVRADSVASDDAKNEIIALRKKLDKAEARISKSEQNRADQEGELASGSDELRIGGTIRNYDPLSWYDSDEPSIQLTARYEMVSTWNQLLRVIAGHKQKAFSNQDLGNWVCGAILDAIRSGVTQPNEGDWSQIHIEIDNEEFTKITTQFCALNLIVHRNSYPTDWAFTQKGLYHGSRQQALKKGELYSGDAPWAQVVIGDSEEKTRRAKRPPSTTEEW